MEDTFFPKRYLVTSALPYANGPLHLGHLAGAYLSGDAYVRFQRLMSKDILYVCGSDEYGAAISMKARQTNVSPRDIVDKYHNLIKETFERIGMSFDIYHRTTADVHAETSQDFFRNLYKKGVFVENTTEQYFDEEAGLFLADRYIKGECPRCGYADAYGDQCESCGSTLSPSDLLNPVSLLTGSQPTLKSTTHWYLPLDQNEEWLRTWISQGILEGREHHDPSLWKNHVIGQCMSWIDQGLQPRSMTRDLDWGVDVPPEIPGSEGKKLYVWMDAPIGYISATRQWARDNNKDWEQYWKDEDTELVHFIGKDNIVFHCLIFPAILRTHGDFILPKNIPANQFLNLEGRKLSTSKGWAVWVHEYLDELPGKEDVLRYVLYKTMPEQKDSEFTWKGWQDANNNELVNNLGNFINRVVVLTQKYYNGIVPAFDPDLEFTGSKDEEMPIWHDSEMLDLFDRLDQYGALIRKFEFRSALRVLMEISSAGNIILQQNEPWKLIKEDEETVKVVMNCCLQYATSLSVILYPFLPFTSAKLREILNLPPLEGSGELLELMGNLAEGEPLLPDGHTIGEAVHLFDRIEDEVVETQIRKLQMSAEATAPITEKQTPTNPPSEVQDFKPEITFDDFQKLDLRIATVTEASKIEKADKLLKITLDVGSEARTVVSGIAQHFPPESIVGQRVVYVSNLAPRKMRGVVSQGMILMAEDGDGKLAFVEPKEDVTPGSIVS
ncbi:MAG TPA: methionine--tRNA ligase [Membranihabitans sp.]|nr:methionine--tRNA ligase [Membranihabitans sp.]